MARIIRNDPTRDDMATTPVQADLIAHLARFIRARVIVEAGTYKGTTSIALARNNPDAQVYTADTVKHDLVAPPPPNLHLYGGDFIEMLATIPEPIDFAYIDATPGADTPHLDPHYRWRAAEAVIPRLRPGAIIAFDDTDATDSWDGLPEIRSLCQINLTAPNSPGLSIYQH